MKKPKRILNTAIIITYIMIFIAEFLGVSAQYLRYEVEFWRVLVTPFTSFLYLLVAMFFLKLTVLKGIMENTEPFDDEDHDLLA